MGRRKIEIKAIKDDRNRSVTFLKRKGGLFKKAHELSILCSVDVAVIIFGNNKKLYEYSSSDIGEILTRYQYYGGANEHKGPADFNGKGGMDDDDDEGGSPQSTSVEPQMMPPQFQPQFQHLRHTTPSSPPVPNGGFQQLPPRQHTPQPSGGSRPPSRGPGMAPRRSGSNLGPNAGPPPNGFAYMPSPAIYNPQNGQQMPQHGMPQHLQGQQGQAPQYPNYGPPQQVQQIYNEDQRSSSMPPTFPQDRQVTHSPQPQHQPPPPPPQEESDRRQSQQSNSSLMPEPVKRMSLKARSIFTPIDESRSILSQHWASSTSLAEPSPRSQSMDVGAMSRVKNTPPPTGPPRSQTQKSRGISMSSMSGGGTPPSRQNSLSMGGGKRPVLKVQIPDEGSDGEGSNTADSGSPNSATGAPRRNGESHAGVVLPPPSPSASAILSAGATGPPNPFARPPPPSQHNSNNNNNNGAPNHINTNNLAAPVNGGPTMMETPISALPSRFMTNEFLPSPSSFYQEWNFRGPESNTLPSPLNFATPVVGTGPSFLRDESGEGKRKTPDYEEGKAESHRVKRLKQEG